MSNLVRCLVHVRDPIRQWASLRDAVELTGVVPPFLRFSVLNRSLRSLCALRRNRYTQLKSAIAERNSTILDLAMGYVDIHSHILYGLDDGARTRAQSVAMLEMAARSG